MAAIGKHGRIARELARMRYLLYVLAALFSFIAFLAAFAPASPIWSMVQADVARAAPDLRVYAVRGTVWQGEADIQFRQFPQSTITWQLQAAPLISGTAKLNLGVQGPGLALQSDVTVSEQSASVQDLNGTIRSDYINTLSEISGFTFSNELSIAELNLDLNLHLNKGVVSDASGTALWPGGRILLQTPNGPQATILPALNADLSSDNATLTMKVAYQQEPLLLIQLKPDGWAQVDLMARLFELAALPLPDGAPVDGSVLLIEEKIL